MSDKSEKLYVTKDDFEINPDQHNKFKTDFEFVMNAVKESRDHWACSATSLTYRRAAVMLDVITKCYSLMIDKEYSKSLGCFLKVDLDHLKLCFKGTSHDKLKVRRTFQDVYDSLLTTLQLRAEHQTSLPLEQRLEHTKQNH